MTSLVDLGTLDGRLAGIRRPADVRFTSGLCRAVGERLGIDPLVIRVVTVVLTLAAGLGLALYFWGTVLTPRVGSEAPVRRLIPAFERWTMKSQLLVIIISTLVVVILTASTASVPIGPAVIIIVLVLMAKRRGHRVRAASPGSTEPPAATPATVEQWRARLSEHARVRTVAGDPLPTVDLYGTETRPVAVSRPRPARTSWLGAVAIVVLGLGAGLLLPALGIGRNPVLMAMATCTLTVGLAMALWGLLISSRRLPTLLVVVALTGAAVTAATAVQQATPVTVATEAHPDSASNTLTYEFVADGNAVVDLTYLPLEATTSVRIDAVASKVRILLPGLPREITMHNELSEVTDVGARTLPATDITLEVHATISKISLEYSE